MYRVTWFHFNRQEIIHFLLAKGKLRRLSKAKNETLEGSGGGSFSNVRELTINSENSFIDSSYDLVITDFGG